MSKIFDQDTMTMTYHIFFCSLSRSGDRLIDLPLGTTDVLALERALRSIVSALKKKKLNGINNLA